ncbi:hypothetical protein [Aquisalinus flavus]|nr:hypothetical protein [Aquisalinus flavus]MBD0425424.1 hypothetical protein [Aquisalinus flavus]UNE48935.1 hypothetical protein FF099_13185 [Aquisalinus flavus]
MHKLEGKFLRLHPAFLLAYFVAVILLTFSSRLGDLDNQSIGMAMLQRALLVPIWCYPFVFTDYFSASSATRFFNRTLFIILMCAIPMTLLAPVFLDMAQAKLVQFYLDGVILITQVGLVILAAGVLNARETAPPNNVARQFFYALCFAFPYLGAFAIRPKALSLMDNQD